MSKTTIQITTKMKNKLDLLKKQTNPLMKM